MKPRGSAPGRRQAGKQLAEQVEQLGLLGFIQPRQQAAHVGHVRRHDAVDQGEAGFASLCLAFPPLLTYVLALALRMEGLQRLRLLGILIGLAGSLILALGKLGSGDSPLLWVLATLVMPVFLAIGGWCLAAGKAVATTGAVLCNVRPLPSGRGRGAVTSGGRVPAPAPGS